MKTPSYDELEDFFKYDQWTEDRSTGHGMYEKVLPSDEILRSHRSFSGKKTMSPGRFKAILSLQLLVSDTEFWEVLRTKKPATRPSPAPEPEPMSLPYWVSSALEAAGVTQDDLATLDEQAARRLLDEIRSRPT